MNEKLLPMRTIKVHYDDGDVLITRIRATIPECVKMYLRGYRVKENYQTGKETYSHGRCIEFLDRNQYNGFDGKVHVVKRVYSLSDAFMRRYDLHSRFRFTENVYSKEDWRFAEEFAQREYKHDAAYLVDYDALKYCGYTLTGKGWC